MLQELLNLGLVEIGSDDSRLEKMQSAAKALSEKFDESPELLIPATLIALDQDVDETEPLFDLIESLVIDKWKTLRNTHANRPRQLLRSVAISALAAAVADDAARSAIVWNTAAARLLHSQTKLGKESALINKILNDAFKTAESEAVIRAGIVSRVTTKKPRKKRVVSTPNQLSITGAIQVDDILADVASAAGPSHPNTELEAANPVWPNSHQRWSNEFSPRMTAALVKAVNMGTTKLAQSLTSGLAQHFEAIKSQVMARLEEGEKRRAEQVQSATSNRMRLDVLWWSHARYSPSQTAAYAALPPGLLALVAVSDLAAIVPEIAPVSVTHVLGELVSACGSAEPVSLLRHLNEFRPEASLLTVAALPESESTGRIPLIEFVANVVRGAEVSAARLSARTGLDPELLLSRADFAMWLFRGLQGWRISRALQ